MAKDRDNIRDLYDEIVEEAITPLAVQKSATGEGETGGLQPDELPADAASTTEVQKGTGPEAAKDVEHAEEAEEKLSPVKADKGTKKTATSKKVTAIKDSVEPRKSFMDLFDQVMVNEEGGADIESPSKDEWDEAGGDFPEGGPEVEDEVGAQMSEGEIYAQLSDLFGQLAEVKGSEVGGEMDAEADMDAEAGMEDEMPAPAAESVKTIDEMKSEPEPKEDHSNSSERQLPTKLAGKGVTKGATKKAHIKGNDKKRTGELEDAPEGMKHDKSKYAVKGEGPAHKAKNASFLES